MVESRSKGKVHYDNSGRVVLVSGGASGIGRAVCDAFLTSGAHVVCFDVDEIAASDLPDDGIEFVRGDVAVEQDCQNAVQFAVERHGGLDILVNNAAIQPPASYVPVHELSSELWSRMVEVNLSGYTWLAKHALRQMKQQQSGVVINIASGQGHRTAREVPAYGPIKAANILQARQWGVE